MALTTDDEVIRIMAEQLFDAQRAPYERPWAATKADERRWWLTRMENVLRALRAAGFEIGRPGVFGEEFD
jgi:hypothetical protein